MQRNATTQYPILLVHGLFGFDKIGQVELFQGIKQALRAAGARVFVPHLSATHCNEARGEQLLAQLDRVLAGTGVAKVNLIGYSQGALAARYAGARACEHIASVTSVSGPNHGSELADFLRKALSPGCLPELLAEGVAALFVDFVTRLNGQPRLQQDAVAALAALTTEGVGAFNQKYPQALPTRWGGDGPGCVNGVRYYSWSGTLQDAPDGRFDGADPMRAFCRAFSRYFITEAGQNDGMVGRFSSHLGEVIRSDYPMDHLQAIHPASDPAHRHTDPVGLYVQHAERLREAGL